MNDFDAAAYGGKGWSPRVTSLRDELGDLWARCGLSDEYSPLRSVLLHSPGDEWENIEDENAVQMLQRPDLAIARQQHDAMANFYQGHGIEVRYIEPLVTPTPNLLFAADLFFMTPEGAIIARPASTVRAGEERWVAQRLAALGVPILRTIRGNGTFEGADAMWLDNETVLIGQGLRTNQVGAEQVASILAELGVATIIVDLPVGTMHLMGQLRIIDADLAIAWPYRLSHVAANALKSRGYELVFLPDETEASEAKSFNIVILGPREVLMPDNCPVTRAFYESLGITCHCIAISELAKAAGAIGCMTGIIHRGG